MRILLLLLAALTPLPTLAVSIYSVEPGTGPMSGGTKVSIRGDGFLDVCNAPCPGLIVTFGGIAATGVRIVDSRTISAITPATVTPGPVDVEWRYVVSVAGYHTFSYDDPDAVPDERIMFPVLSKSFAGANGALWRTRLLVHNGGAGEVWLEPEMQCSVSACPHFIPFQPNSTMEIAWRPLDDRSVELGRFAIVARGDPSLLTFHLVAEDATRLDLTAGTELPVVRASAFRGKPLRLIGVVADPKFRHHLRIYTSGGDTTVTVKTFAISTDGLVRVPSAVRSVGLTRATEDFYLFPSAELDVDPMLPAGGGQSIVEIQAPADVKIWGFLSVTNNVTQHITTITPQ